MEELIRMGEKARAAAAVMGRLGINEKNRGLEAAAQALLDSAEDIIRANEQDMENGRKKGMPEGLLDRLKLDKKTDCFHGGGTDAGGFAG